MQACYEQAIQTEPDDVTHHQGLLRGLMDLGQHSKALTHCTGAIAERYRNDPKLPDRQMYANSADPDQTAPSGADQGLN